MPPDVLDLFSELAAVPSPPGEERAVADRVIRYLRDCGLDLDEDGCGAEIGSTMGNLYTRIEPTAPGEPLLFCAHLDTVPPTAAIEPVVDDGIVRNAAGTILGADNKAAVAAMLEATRLILAERRPHAGIELLFTPKEEVGLVGASAFDHTRLRARTGYVYDQAAPIGVIILGAPSCAVARGDVSRARCALGHASRRRPFGDRRRRPRHLGAPARACRRWTPLRMSARSQATPPRTSSRSGARSSRRRRSQDERKLADLIQEMQDAITFAAGVAECDVETKARKSYRGYRFAKSDRAVALAAAALARRGHDVTYELSGGAADANVFNERGLECVNLANGMADIHTPAEHIAVADLEAMVDVTCALVESALAQ